MNDDMFDLQLATYIESAIPAPPQVQENAALLGLNMKEYVKLLLLRTTNVRVIDRQTKLPATVKWIPGHVYGADAYGPRPADIAIIGKMPGREELANEWNFVGPTGQKLRECLGKCNFTPERFNRVFVSNILHFVPPSQSSTLPADYIKFCSYILFHELALVKPKYVLLLGADAVKVFFGKSATLKTVQGGIFDSTQEFGKKDSKLHLLRGAKIMATTHPARVLREPNLEDWMTADLRRFINMTESDMEFIEGPKTEYTELFDVGQVDAALREGIEKDVKVVSVDAEWFGKNYRSGKLRTIQFGWEKGKAYVMVLTDTKGKPVFKPSIAPGMSLLRKFLQRDNLTITGHFMRADLKWLYDMGINLDQCRLFDTSNAHHILDETGAHDLKSCALRYTDMGRYDCILGKWREENKPGEDEGYGTTPDDILHPYGAADVDATLQLYHIFSEQLEREPGLNNLFWEVEMRASRPLLEMEMTGVLTDEGRINELTEAFHAKRDAIQQELRDTIGNPDFNPRSTLQVQRLLYDLPLNGGLGLTPLKITGRHGKPWQLVVNDKSMGYDPAKSFCDQDRFSPSTDAETLDILALDSPICECMHRFRVIDQVCKQFLRMPIPNAHGELEFDGGLGYYVHTDGRIRTTFSQLLETGRFSSSKPNLQNLPNKQEDEFKKIMGAGVPSIRSCIVAPPGSKLIESDYKSAEVVVLAYLSGDPQLKLDAVAKPDMHSINAVEMLGAKCQPEDVKKHPEFSGLRIAAKSISFGIPYQRGVKALTREIQRRGVSVTVEEVEGYVKAYYKRYPFVKNYVKNCKAAVTDIGYIINPFGRKRRFNKASDDSVRAAQEREAVNFPIQSTVAEAMSIALWNLWVFRKARPDLEYKMILTVHDSVILEVPDHQVEEVVNVVLPACMQGIRIPHFDFELDIDATVYQRWNEELK